MITKTYPLSILDDEPIITNASLREQDQERIAALEADLEQSVQMYMDAAQERDEAIAAEIKADAAVTALIKERDEALINESKAIADLAAAQTRADAMLRVAEKHEAEAAALRVDVEQLLREILHYDGREGEPNHRAWLLKVEKRFAAIDQARTDHIADASKMISLRDMTEADFQQAHGEQPAEPVGAPNKHGVECVAANGCKYGSKCRSECEVRRAVQHLASLQPAHEKPAEPVTYTVRGLQCGTCGAWSDHRVSPDPRIAALEGLLMRLHALVKGECPQLLDDDRGGDGVLALDIEAALGGSK